MQFCHRSFILKYKIAHMCVLKVDAEIYFLIMYTVLSDIMIYFNKCGTLTIIQSVSLLAYIKGSFLH